VESPQQDLHETPTLAKKQFKKRHRDCKDLVCIQTPKKCYKEEKSARRKKNQEVPTRQRNAARTQKEGEERGGL
jgi:hypothetical protein